MAGESEDETLLMNLIETYTEWRLKSSPEYATAVDIHTFNDRLEDQSLEAYEQRYQYCKELLNNLDENVKRENLKPRSSFLYDLLRDDLEVFTQGYVWRHHSVCNAVNFLETIAIDFMSYLVDSSPFNCCEDFAKYVMRLEAIPRQVAQQTDLLNEAIKHGTTLHKCSVERLITHLDKQISSPLNKSIFFEPVEKKLPLLKDASDEKKEAISAEIQQCIEEKVLPCFQRLQEFISSTYMPKCRSGYGVKSLPDGEEFYKACLKWHTTTDMSPQEVHDLGKTEVARIQANMKEIMKEVNFEGSIAEFTKHLKRDPKFIHDEPSAMLNEFNCIIDNHITPKLSDFFDDIPDVKCEVREMPFEGPGGMYFPASADGKRPGIFYVQLLHLHDFPRFTMMSLALHEAVPGHHFQHISGHAHGLPKFHCERDYRKLYAAPFQFPINTAYVEGWALYTEFLGEEMCAYRDLYDMFGRYSDEMFRATRLVVDTGLHVFGWSREEAVAYMKENCAIAEGEIEEEVDRYMTWPGQACAYKIGELKIKALRKEAEETLGHKFNIKEFHKVVLAVGPVSLKTLEFYVKKWVSEVKRESEF